MKRVGFFLALLLCCSLLLSVSAAAADADSYSGSCGENAVWTLENGTLTISGTGDMNFTSPPWAPYRDSIRKVVIQDGITSIGPGTFQRCPNLTSVRIPGSVKTFATSALYGSNNLTSAGPIGSGCSIEFGWTETIPAFALQGGEGLLDVYLPDSLTDIGRRTFYGSSSLLAFHVGENNRSYQTIDGVLYSKDGETLVRYPAGRDEAEYIIPDNVKALAPDAFSTSKIERIRIPEGVTELPAFCFANSKNLQTIVFPQSLTTLRNESLWGIGMQELTIPAGVTTVDGHFAGDGLENIYVDPDNQAFTSIDGVMFSKDRKTLVAFPELRDWYVIPSGTENIREHAFAFSNVFVQIVIPRSVKTIADTAFYSCRNLGSVVYYGSRADWEKIEIAERNNSLLNADLMCLYDWFEKRLVLPESLTTIESEAFVGVDADAVFIPASVREVAEDAFDSGIAIFAEKPMPEEEG